MPTKKKPKNYESAMERLEEITEKLESGEADLEQAIALYTEGLEIAEFCDSKLSDAEAKIKIITKENDLMAEEDFQDEAQ